MLRDVALPTIEPLLHRGEQDYTAVTRGPLESVMLVFKLLLCHVRRLGPNLSMSFNVSVPA